MEIIFINPTPPLPGGHDGGTNMVFWILEYLRNLGHTIRVIYLENTGFDGIPYCDEDRKRDYQALREIGVEEIRSVPIPAKFQTAISCGAIKPSDIGFLFRLRRSIAYRLARLRTEGARSNHIADHLKTMADEMRGDVCFSFVEILKDIRNKPTKPLVSWMFQTGEPFLELNIEFGFRKVLGSQGLARLLLPLHLAAHHRSLGRLCDNADHMIVPSVYYARIWRRIMKGRSCIHHLSHPAKDESDELTRQNPTQPPEGKPYRIVLFGHLRAGLTTAGLVHFADHILTAIDRSGRQEEFEFHIVGKFEPYPFVARKLQRANIHFKGFVENLADTLNGAHAVLVPIPVLPGPGMRLSSACAVSACIVTHHVTAIGSPEYVNGENCLMASSGEEFVDALVRVCENRDLSRRLRAAARRTYDENYRMEDCGRAVEKILEEAISA